jgi:hypothetical protein
MAARGVVDWLFGKKVQLHVAQAEPNQVQVLNRLRHWHFLQAQQLAVEGPRSSVATRRAGNTYVLDLARCYHSFLLKNSAIMAKFGFLW